MILNEIFDNPSPIMSGYDSPDMFAVEKQLYRVFYERAGRDAINVHFAEVVSGPDGRTSDDWGISKSSNPIKVFSSVVASIRQRIQRQNITRIKFTADMRDGDGSRSRLYDRMARSLLPDWNVDAVIEDGEKYYTITSPKHSKFSAPTDYF